MNKTLNSLVWPILAAPLAYLALVWNTLPEQVAIHFPCIYSYRLYKQQQ